MLGGRWVGRWWWFPAITLSQPNYFYDCFVVGVVVVVGLDNIVEVQWTLN